MLLKTFIFIGVFAIGCNLLSIQIPFASYWGKSHKSQSICSKNNNKLLSILNLLCNSTQTVSITTRDACYGCFFRAGSLPPGQTQLTALSQCSSIYINGTNYGICAANLAAIVNGMRPTTPPAYGVCYTGYCDFVRCVRRINSNLLIDSCFTQNQINRDLTMQNDRLNLYKNITSCILARTRCNPYNPITGELQVTRTTGQYGEPYENFYNSLQISLSGDIRIITFTSSTNIADYFCSSKTTLEQTTYGDAVC